MNNANLKRKEIGNRVRRKRKTKNLTVQQLAELSGISASYLSEVERGIPAVSTEKLIRIAENLGVSLIALLEGSSRPGGEQSNDDVIPAALSEAAEELGLTYSDTVGILRGKQSLVARRSNSQENVWAKQDWIEFYEKVKDYMP